MAFSITIVNAPAITTQSPLPDAEVGIPYVTAFTAVNGGGTYSWSSSAPPAGLMLSSSGVLSGTPTTAGTFPIVVTATVPNAQPPVSLSATFSLMVAPALAFTTSSPLPSGVVGTPYSQAIGVTGGFPQPQGTGYSFTGSGTLPPGLTFTTGVLSGTPTMMGTFLFTLAATDTQNFTVSKQFQVTIAPATALLQVSPTTLAFSGFVGGSAAPPQTIAIVATGASAESFSISVDGGSAGTAAPAWITVQPTSGTAPCGVTVIANPGSMGVGTYPATIHITVPNNTAQSTINVAVTFMVSAGTPTLAVAPASLNLGALVQTPSTQNPVVVVSNSGGGGALGFSASLVGHSAWITSVSPIGGNAAPNAPVLIQLTINSQGLAVGNYHDILQIASPYGVVDVPISLFVSADGSIIGLSVNGVRFDERQGNGTNRPQVVQVLNRGDLSIPLNPTVEILSGSDWLNISPALSASRSTLVAATLTLTAGGDTTSLPTGGKYALVRVSDPNAQNSPVYLIAVVEVDPAATPALPDPSPPGVFFTPTTAAQTISIYTSSATPAAFQASASTNDGGAWLAVSPATGIASTQNAGSVSVQVNATGVAGGIHTGNVNISIGGVLRSVNVTLAVPPPVTGTPFARATSACAPTLIAITQSGIVDDFSVPAGWPASLIVQLYDNCGNPISNGSVVASFSNGDPPLPLAGDGTTNVYSATWQPGVVVPSMTVTVNASSGTLTPAVAQFVGGVNPNASPAPTLVPSGTLHIFFNVATAAALGGGLAPGNVAQVYGTGLASAALSPNVVPLVNQFNGTFMLVGPVQVPLFYISPNQLDVQIPVELTPNIQYSGIVSANGALTLPETVTLVPLQPGMAANADGTVIAQHTADYSLVTAAHLAAPGEPLVIYLAGMGATNPVVASGNPTPEELVPANVQPTVTVDGVGAAIGYAGLTPGGVGLYQINFTVPPGARSGNLNLVVMQNSMPANTTTLPVSN
jgi:uncharacterized protein (TIGR03437 family)